LICGDSQSDAEASACRQGYPGVPGIADERGAPQDVTSSDVNDYLREISSENITTKDFRTWGGTVLAAVALQEFKAFDSAAAVKKNIRPAIERVAARNTPSICRKCYIHPELLNGYMDSVVPLQMKAGAESELRDNMDGLSSEEAAVLATLRARLGGDMVRTTPQYDLIHARQS
jgi:DNA topoisomerase I